MKKIQLLLFSSIFLAGCTNPIRYFMGERQQDGLVFILSSGITTVIKFAEELQDDEIIYIPSSLRSDWSGEPLPIVIGGSPWLGGVLESDALKLLYVTGSSTTFYTFRINELTNLELIAFNTLHPSSLQLPIIHPMSPTQQSTLKWLFSHEAYESVIHFYYDMWNEWFGIQVWEHPSLIISSRASYYYNYDGSPNEGLYRIGMEYVLGADLTPPDDPTRIKHQNLFGTEYYTFKGWSSDATTFIPYDFESSDDDINVQLYAHWE